MSITDLVPSLSIENFLAQRDAMVERARAARGLLQEIHAIAKALPDIPNSSGWLRFDLNIEPERREFTSDEGFTMFVRGIDAACWARLLDLSGLRTFMDAEARKQWDANIHDRKVPELTYANVEATFAALYTTRGDMFDRGVIAVFKSLSWDYKTNNPVMFGKRIIVRNIYEVWGPSKSRHAHTSHTGANKLDDIMRVLSILDGKPEPDHRNGAYYRLNAGKRGMTFTVVDFDGYFTVKGYKNGNGHITFLRPDLVDKMNQIIAKHYPGALPPGTEDA